MNYSVEIDREAIAEAVSLFEFVGGNTSAAMSVAINRTARLARSSTKRLPGGGASQRIRKQVNLPRPYVSGKDGKLKLRTANRNDLKASISAPSRGVLMTRFSTDSLIAASADEDWLGRAPDEPPRGIRVKVKPSGSATVFTGTKGKNLPSMEGKPFFIVGEKSRKLLIARRLAGSRKVHVFHGPSLSQVFNRVKDKMMPVVNERLQFEMLDAMRSILAKKYPKE